MAMQACNFVVRAGSWSKEEGSAATQAQKTGIGPEELLIETAAQRPALLWVRQHTERFIYSCLSDKPVKTGIFVCSESQRMHSSSSSGLLPQKQLKSLVCT